nr:galactoside 3(4)-L-fucosyltransferase-like [Ciona intestinalis]|eukprot:XP_002120878.5 galactoside 3(4)-L-fucosyltransferase-like [Ciona intestinalis]
MRPYSISRLRYRNCMFVGITLSVSCCTFILMITSQTNPFVGHVSENQPIRTAFGSFIPFKKRKTVILSWRRPWGYAWKGHAEGHTVGECVLTYDRSRIQEAAAVIFHYTALDEETLPWKHFRKPSQYYVFWAMDNPAYMRNNENFHPNHFDRAFINWTMTYRLMSDVFYPFLNMEMAKNIFSRGSDFVEENLKHKEKLALWVVNDCELLRGSKLRMEYANALVEAGLPLDRYGWCFNNKQAYKKLSDEVLLSYKFYLAFEETQNCIDYLTDEFWEKGVLMGRVPVVWGPTKMTVARLAPPGSYIHTDNFESPAKLVEYLLYLDQNDEAYLKYFDWYVNPNSETIRVQELYKITGEELLCRKLLDNPRRKVTGDISYFQYGQDWGKCIDS